MLSSVDITLILAYIVALLFIGWYSGKNNKDQEDYFLAGRSMPWLPISLSVAATMISANGFIGGPGWSYNSGIAPMMVNIGVPLAIFVVLFTTMPVIYNLKLTSIYQYIELRLGSVSRTLSVLGFLMNSLIQVSSMVFIPALIIHAITGWDQTVVIPLVVLIAIVYTLIGGIKAVIWTDALQMVVMWLGLIISIVVIGDQTGLGFFETLAQARAAGKLEALDFSFDISKTNAFWAAVIGGTVMWIRYFGFDQGQVQRVLTAKSIRGVRASFLTSAIIMNVMFFILMLLGVMLYVFYDGKPFDTSNGIMIDFILNHLPVGVAGLIVAGVFAAAMSSVDSLLNSMSTVYVKDIHERFIASEHKEASLRMSMTISATWGVLVILITLYAFMNTTGSILEVVGSYISYISGPMAGTYLLAFFTRKANDYGVAIGIVVSLFGTKFLATAVPHSWIWNPLIGLVICAVVGYGLSMVLPSSKTDEEARKYTVQGQREEMIKSGHTEEDGASTLPLTMDKYCISLLVFFVAQFLVLAMIA